MRTITLGRSGLNVSRIAFGTWQIGGEWGSFDTDAAVQDIRLARERGVNFFDTAQAYGFGKAESILGKALESELKHRRDELVIAAKGGINPGGDRPRHGPRHKPGGGVEQGLRAVGGDHIGL